MKPGNQTSPVPYPKVIAHTKPFEAEDLQNGLGKTDKEGIVTQNSMQKSGKSKKRRKKKIPVLKQASEENYLHPLKKDVIEIQKRLYDLQV
ncbi:uncharacterized protein PGTG_18174 [Puccinia graminis f. sp. tritici CRL 75-36-700-3]|uniref:Uncharacterized protein n=1 Tax=Puccinia graminis f. sp. tritici (strain CRL 75-36-700-3 / race SCCL) TaxID=418459 RepID=E3L6A9_PUCGT|nr:uncharacterized protein PGTG_18174 [Puccinia graminis f. sp. tritici CRL 75-36-700-3]EFP92084.2 hypothetical protein PGTG_18174 [Puccinia graminis f. sp. tritici CRL 75-36-700-3]